MSSTVYFILLLYCFTFTFVIFTLFCSFCFAVFTLFCPVPDSLSNPTPLCFHDLMHFHWTVTLLSFLSISLQHTDPMLQGSLVDTDSPNWHTECTIMSSINSTQYLELPADLTPASRPSADQDSTHERF